MKTQLLALALLITAAGSFAQAGEMKRACLDSKGGTYTVSDNNSMKCENRLCALEAGTVLTSVYEEGAMSTLSEKDSNIATELAMSLQPLVSGPMIEGAGNEPKLYFSPGISILCSSFIPAAEFNAADISSRLSENR